MSTTESEPQQETAPEPTEEPVEPSDPAEEQVDEAEPGEAEEPAEEPAAQAPTGPSMEEIEKVLTKLSTSANTWRRRVAELLGDEAENLVPCELCEPDIPGFHWPAELLQPRDDLHAHLLDVLRTPDAPDYMQASFVRRCDACDGWGRVISGSRVAGKGEVSCIRCKGKGFLGDAELPGAPPEQPSNGEVEFPEDTGPLVTEDTDVWGSPRILADGQENPNYGKMPQYKDKSLP
jgi:hypothetical protein